MLPFNFAGGTNLDAATDDHIHCMQMRFLEAAVVAQTWSPFSGGKEGEKMEFQMTRAE